MRLTSIGLDGVVVIFDGTITKALIQLLIHCEAVGQLNTLADVDAPFTVSHIAWRLANRGVPFATIDTKPAGTQWCRRLFHLLSRLGHRILSNDQHVKVAFSFGSRVACCG